MANLKAVLIGAAMMQPQDINMAFIEQLTHLLDKNSDSKNATYMTGYLRGQFSIFWCKSQTNKELLFE